MGADRFQAFVRAGWEQAAARYEECWTDTALFVDSLLDAAAVGRGTRILDLACGPGYVSERAAARGASPIGLDIARAMLARARRRCPAEAFLAGDAQRLPFPNAAFDAITMNFGILHLSHPETAIAEMRRALAPGGRAAFTAWALEGNVADEIMDAAVAAYAIPVPLPEGPSSYRFADPAECRRTLAAGGFEPGSVRIETLAPLWRIPTPDLLFRAHVVAGVRIGAVLRAQPPERLDAIHRAVVEGVRRYADGTEFALPVVARVVAARVA